MRRKDSDKNQPMSVRVLLIIVLIIGFATSNAFFARCKNLEKENELLSAQISEIEEENERMAEELSAPFDDEYVKRVARKSLDYCMPGEIIYFNNIDVNKK